MKEPAGDGGQGERTLQHGSTWYHPVSPCPLEHENFRIFNAEIIITNPPCRAAG